jgi:hypothetical protein
MSDDDWGFAMPAFEPESAQLQLARDLRGLGLSERHGLWERRGLAIARLKVETDRIEAARVKRPARSSPEWQTRSLKSSADVRDFVADLKKQLAHWSDDD